MEEWYRKKAGEMRRKNVTKGIHSDRRAIQLELMTEG